MADAVQSNDIASAGGAGVLPAASPPAEGAKFNQEAWNNGISPAAADDAMPTLKPVQMAGPAAPPGAHKPGPGGQVPSAGAAPAPAKPSPEQMARKLAAAQGRSFLPAARDASPAGAVASAAPAAPVEAHREELANAAMFSDDPVEARHAAAKLKMLDAARNAPVGGQPAAPPKSPKPR